MYDVLLVHIGKRGFQKIGAMPKSADVDKTMLTYCEMYEAKLRKDYDVFVARKDGAEYRPVYRTQFAPWKEVEGPEYEKIPFTIDVVEGDEKYLFHRAVNLPKEAVYDCLVCHKILLTDDCNAMCEECLADI